MDEQKPVVNLPKPERRADITNFWGNNTIASSIIVAAIIVTIGIVAGSLIISHVGSLGSNGAGAQAGANPPTTNIKVSDRSDQPTMGNTNAPVTIYEFGDFQCPYCKQWYSQTFADIKSKYIDTGKVKFVFRHFPLSQIHVNAEISSEAAECANRQGQFNAYYDMLYTQGQADGTGLDAASLKKYASQIGLNTTQFNQCLDNHETRATVAADEALGASIGINGTPSFIVNGTLISGAEPTATFEQAIDSALKQ